MKYLIVIGDGMGDRPRPELGGLTVLQKAHTPHMDRLAREGALGLAQTIPPGMEPGSDTANMSLLGYDPARYHTGRSPIEAAAMGVDLGPGQVAFRCNLVCLKVEPGGVTMVDYSAGHISTERAARYIATLQERLGRPGLAFHAGVSYRHLLVWDQGPLKATIVPPHDRTGQSVDDVMAMAGDSAQVVELIKTSWPVLADHPLNQELVAMGKPPVNSIWLWGQGTKPQMPTLAQRFGLGGVAISAVDLIKGLGVLAGLTPVEVPGATGFLDTNYAGKVEATLKGLEEGDLALIHVEAPDEAGHSGETELKLRAVEDFDRQVVGPLLAGLPAGQPVRLLLACDHFTPLEVRTHTTEPVPYIIWDSRKPGPGALAYSEAAAAQACAGRVTPGHELINLLVEQP